MRNTVLKSIKAQVAVVFMLLLVGSCSARDSVPDTGGGHGDGETGVGKTLNGTWRGVFETKHGNEPTKSHQASFDFTQEGNFVLTFQEGDKPKATGTWEDGGEALLLRVKESSILPEFPPESFVKLTYRVRGKTLSLTSEESGAFMLTRQDEGSSSGDSKPQAPSGPFGWWKGLDQNGVAWGIQLDEAGSFWAQAGDLIMRGVHRREADDVLYLEVQEAGESGLIGRKLIFRLMDGKAVLAVLRQNGTTLADVIETITMERSGQ